MKKINYIFIILCLGFVSEFNAQTPQALLNRTKHWRFGHKAGLDFNMITGIPTVFNGSDGVVYEGNSCISDTLGNLLFYCTGDTIWNKNHQMMLNGDGMMSDKVTILNSCIIPRPGNANQYFLFVNECVNNSCTGGKLYYSLIDITLDGGNGAVVVGQKNIVVMLQSYNAGLAFTKHANGIDYWLSYFEPLSPYNYCMIKVTNAGPDTINRVISAYAGGGGFNRFSPDATKFAGEYKVYQFNNLTGILSNEINLPTDSLSNYNPFSMEFSPNSQMLYYPLIQGGGYRNVIQQFNLSVFTQTAVAASVYSFFDSSTPLCFCGIGHAQLALNGKIYIARAGGFIDTLHIIHNPNAIGAACNFQYDAIGLNNHACNFSLPIYPDYYFTNTPLLTTVNEKAAFNNLKISVYPNPCNEELNISHSVLNNYSYFVYNALGQLLYKTISDQVFNKINTRLLPNGVYSLVVLSSFGSQSKKIIINHV